MSARAGENAHRSAGVRSAALIIVVAIGATVLDQAPWFPAWALAALLLAEMTTRVTPHRHRMIRRRVVFRPAAAGLIMAVIVWGASGAALNQAARRQLRARPAAAVAAYVRQHAARVHPRTRQERRRAQRRQQVLMTSPAARLYGVAQLGRWHWQRLIAGDSALLGGPLALWGISVGLGLARRRQRRTRPHQPPISSLSQHGQSSLRTAGRGR